jgi:hypothetical protein
MKLALGALAVLLSSLHAKPAAASEVPVARYAIVIGNNRSEQGAEHNLRYADDDAAAIHELLVEAGVNSVLLTTLDEDSRRLRPRFKTNGAARARDVERAFTAQVAEMRGKIARGIPTEFLLFYSGHGNVDRGEGYVVLDDQRLSRTMLHSLLTRSPATRNHVFVDACRSFFLAYGKGPGGEREPYAGTLPIDAVPASLKNTGFVLSTSSDRESHEWERFQAGILSYELRSALRGAADTNLDGRVSYGELGAFLKVANESIPNSKFRPEFTLRPPARNFKEEILAWNPDSAAVRLGSAKLGHIYLETTTGHRLLDVHPEAGQPLNLYVSASERPLFVRKYDETGEYVVMDRRPAEITALESAPQIASKGALHIALEQLFSKPFSRRDVEAYERSTPLDVVPIVDRGVQPSNTREIVGTTAAVVALSAAAAGVTLSSISAVNYFQGEGQSQRDLKDTNERVRKLNLASIVCYAVAGAAGATWGLTKLLPVSVTPSDRGFAKGMTFDVGGRF